ncbi:hypothetical protein BH11BAC5_BH11BAC5_52350 [soil metagenome]
MYLQYVKQVGAAIRVALAKVAGKLFSVSGTLALKAKYSLSYFQANSLDLKKYQSMIEYRHLYLSRLPQKFL